MKACRWPSPGSYRFGEEFVIRKVQSLARPFNDNFLHLSEGSHITKVAVVRVDVRLTFPFKRRFPRQNLDELACCLESFLLLLNFCNSHYTYRTREESLSKRLLSLGQDCVYWLGS